MLGKEALEFIKENGLAQGILVFMALMLALGASATITHRKRS